MKQVMVLRDVKVLKTLFNKWRSKILQHLTVQEHTVKQLSDVLGINPGTVYHHVKALQEAGLVEETRTEIEKNIVMRFYRAAAEEFRVDFNIISNKKDEEIAQWVKSRVKGLIDTLKAYKIDIPEDRYPEAEGKITEFINLENKLKEQVTPEKPELLNSATPATVRDTYTLMTHYHLNQNKQYVELREKLLNFLKQYETT